MGKTYKDRPKRFDDDYAYGTDNHDARKRERQQTRDERRKSKNDLKSFDKDIEDDSY